MLQRRHILLFICPLLCLAILVIIIVIIVHEPKKSKSANLNIPIPQVTKAEEAGLVQNPLRPQLVRDGGAGAKVGDRYLWTFGDTLFNPRSVDGSSGRSNTAGYAELNEPFKIAEPLDANRAPSQFIPFSASDKAYNDKTKKGDDRFAIWPGLVVPRPEKKDALVYFLRLKVNPGGGGLNYDLLNSGLARVDEGSTQAEVIAPELFKKPETLYNGPGFTKDGYVYSYECPSTSLKKCSISRVEINEAQNRAKYQFWDGNSWQSNINSAAKKFPGSSAGAGIGWLPKFKRYIIVYNIPFGKRIMYTTSPNLISGWEKPKELYVAEKSIYAVTYHPDLTSNDGKTITLTYYQSGSGIHAVRVTFK